MDSIVRLAAAIVVFGTAFVIPPLPAPIFGSDTAFPCGGGVLPRAPAFGGGVRGLAPTPTRLAGAALPGGGDFTPGGLRPSRATGGEVLPGAMLQPAHTGLPSCVA